MMQTFALWLAVAFCIVLGLCVIAGLLCKSGKAMCSALRGLWRCGLAFVVLAVVAVIYGGTKNIRNRVTADTGLTVVAADLTVPTNDVENAFLVLKWLGPDEDQPFRARDSVSEPWGYIGDGWLYDYRFYENGTNTATWWVDAPASNVVPRVHYHLGNDLPPVEITGDGVTIMDFQDSSTNVVLTYAVERAVLGDSAGTVRVEVQEDRGSVWMEVRWDAVSDGCTNTVAIPGFWIGKDTRWRVRLEVNQ